MKLLLDTHTFVWALSDSSRLSSAAADALADIGNDIVVSIAAAYEIEYKRQRDLALALLPDDLLSAAADLDFRWAVLDPEQAALAGRLPKSHKDPWDRIVAAQAISLAIPVVSVDHRLKALGAETLW